MRRLFLVVFTVLAAAIIGCSPDGDRDDTLDPERVERFLERDLPQDEATAINVDHVRCAERVKDRDPRTFTCRFTAYGSPAQVRIEQDGDRLRRLDAVLVVATLEAFMQEQFEAQLGVAVVVECSPNGNALISVAPGVESRCSATDAEGASVPAPFSVEDLDGNVTVDLVDP